MKKVRSKFAPLTAVGCAAALILVSPVSARSAPSGPPLILVNGKRLDLQDADPITRNGRLLVPMRAIFEALDADVTWNQALNTVIAKRGDQTLTLRPGLTGAQLNGTLVEVSPPAQLVEGRIFVPLRFVSRVLGGDVSWDQARNMVLIQAPPPQDAEPPAPLPDPGAPIPPVQPNPAVPDNPVVIPPVQTPPVQAPPVQPPPVQAPPIQAPAIQNPALPFPPVEQPPVVQPPIQVLPPLMDPGVPMGPQPGDLGPDEPLPIVPVPVPVPYPPIVVIPDNPVPDNPRPWPRPHPDRDELYIDDIDIEGPDNLGLGSTLTFEVRATPNARVTAYLSPGIGVIPLREERNRDGVYSGTYTAGRGDSGRLVRPSIQLDRYGRKVERRANRTISIDTVAPRLVSSTLNQGDQLDQLPDKVRLRYEDSDTNSVARADAVLTTSRGREVLAAQVDNNTVDVHFNPRTNADGIMSLEVRTFDRAGNQATDKIDFRVRAATSNPGPFPPRQPDQQLDLQVLGADAAPGGWYREGQQIVVRAKATPGARLHFMLADPDHGGDMVETPLNSGRFEGRYTVKGNDTVQKPVLRVIAERNGSQVQKDLALQIAVDAVAPAVTALDPAPGTVFNQPIREVNLQVDDSGGSGLKDFQAVLVMNGTSVQLTPEFDGNKVRLGIGPRIRDGLNGTVELRIGLLDNAGNVRKQRYSYTFNTAAAPAQQLVRILNPRSTPGQAPFAISGQAAPGAQILVTMTVAGPQVNPRTATAMWTVKADAQGQWQTPLATIPDRIRTPSNTMTIMAALPSGAADQVTVKLK